MAYIVEQTDSSSYTIYFTYMISSGLIRDKLAGEMHGRIALLRIDTFWFSIRVGGA
jgi:hypothetical protein